MASYSLRTVRTFVDYVREVFTPRPGEVTALTGWRGLLALSVLFYHWIPPHQRFFLQLGRHAVDMFFCLSGFFITRQVYRIYQRTSNNEQAYGQQLRRFCKGRVLRTFPPYYTIVLGSMVLSTCFGLGHLDFATSSPWAAIGHLLYQNDWMYALGVVDQNGMMVEPLVGTAFTPAWSLACEEWFYFSVVLLLWLRVRKEHIPKIALIGILGSLILRTLLGYFYIRDPSSEWIHLGYLARRWFFCTIDGFAIGVLLAWAEETLRKGNKSGLQILLEHFIYGRIWAYTAVIALLLAVWLSGPGLDYRPVVHGDGILWVANQELKTRRLLQIVFTTFADSYFFSWVIAIHVTNIGSVNRYTKKVLCLNGVRWLGVLSYGIYIYHFFVPYFAELLSLDGMIRDRKWVQQMYYLCTSMPTVVCTTCSLTIGHILRPKTQLSDCPKLEKIWWYCKFSILPGVFAGYVLLLTTNPYTPWPESWLYAMGDIVEHTLITIFVAFFSFILLEQPLKRGIYQEWLRQCYKPTLHYP